MKVMKKTHFIAVTVAAISIAASGDIVEKYYRLAIRGVRGGDIVQLGEFSLYASDGSRVNGGGMRLVEPCAAKSLAPGECFASRKNFARETADKLFDGDPKTKLCVGKLALRESDPINCLAVYFRLPDDAKPVVKYNFCSADDTDRYPERNPTSWAIWCSADGKTWRLLDERTNAYSPKSMLTWWNGSRPYSFGGERPCEDMADEVNPFIGAVTQHPRSALGGHGLGKTFPGAATPCGMIQLSPDTITGGDNGCGYSYHHETIEGFSFTHLSGVGWYGDFGNFQVMPTTGERILDREKAKSAYSHEREVAEAGYYAVTLDRYGIRAEMAAAPRAGILRFTFPESKEARVQIDLGRRVGQIGRWLKHSRQHVKVVDERTIEGRIECPWQDGGWGRGAGRVHYVVNYTCVFSKPFKKFGVWDKEKILEGCREYTGANTGFFAEFDTAPGEQILMRAGLSYVDQEGARKNLANDIPDFDFDRVRAASLALWSDAFAGVKVKGGSVDDRIVFATCLYHALIDPRMIGDVDGRYMGSDGKIYRNEHFTARTVFSGWDVFRSEMPLLTLIRPDIVNDTICSMIRWMELGPRDTLPVWDLFGCTSSCMVGNPIIPCIADAYEKGIRGWDAETAWRLAEATSRRRGNAACGWTPNSLSVTLEYAYDDWCMGKFAEMLGKKDDAKRYYERAGWYKNIWSEEAGWLRSRNADGSWTPWRGRHVHGQGAVESNPWQQGWFVPHDVYGLMELMGGAKKFADELELFFDKAPANFMWGDCYNHPNEVTHLVPFMFPHCGRPWLTQKWTRRICEGAYGNEVYGYVGNEDEGQMSAWYILAASGLHPECPGSGVWILTSPMFPEVSFRLDPKYTKGKSFTIRANGVSKTNMYIRSAKLNGKLLDRAWITTKEVSNGGLLELEMGGEPAVDAFPVRPPR